jgi:peptide chain release factor 2
LTAALESYQHLLNLSADAATALELAKESNDEELIREAEAGVRELEDLVEKQMFRCKMRGEFDTQNAIVEINGGSGGTEAQDWAEMLLRMYTRFAEKKGFKIEVLDYQPGEVAGIKNATLLIEGEFAYGFLRSEQGVHRLVRISPFDSNARRHTSFASVGVTPDIEQDIEVEINEADLRIDTYRSSGAGGQHVNKTDSAVRITHIPSGIVVACQNERSQHKNKDRAMKTLKAKLYELEKSRQAEKMDEIRGKRHSIDFGSQIRSYVMQPYQLVKDLRTDYETSNIGGVLDGEIDGLIESYLLGGES